MEVVVDASVVVHALLPTPTGPAALWTRLRATRCLAPHLVDAEVGSVLRRGVARGTVHADVAESGLRALDDLIDERYPHGNLARTAWRLRHNLSYYDALYVALAARLGHPLLTADARLANAPDLPCAVELISPPSAPAAGRSS